MSMERDDPRRCPKCGTEWDTKLRRVGKARNPLDTEINF